MENDPGFKIIRFGDMANLLTGSDPIDVSTPLQMGSVSIYWRTPSGRRIQVDLPFVEVDGCRAAGEGGLVD